MDAREALVAIARLDAPVFHAGERYSTHVDHLLALAAEGLGVPHVSVFDGALELQRRQLPDPAGLGADQRALRTIVTAYADAASADLEGSLPNAALFELLQRLAADALV